MRRVGMGLSVIGIAMLALGIGACGGSKAKCGNGKLEKYEECDGTDFGGATCTSLGHEGGDLVCREGCAINEDGCFDCGNGRLEGDEACDGAQFGDASCASLGHDGGELACTDACTVDESGCHDCGAADPCAGVTCSDHGTCQLHDCQPYCACDDGYVAGADLACLQAGSCLQFGQVCDSDEQCCHAWCQPDLGVCGLDECLFDEQCEHHGEGDQVACCVEVPYDMPPFSRGDKTCQILGQGEVCGAQDGACGSSCVDGLLSDCEPGTACASWGMQDPYGYCSPYCETDADCAACDWEPFPGTDFRCLPIHTGDTTCQAIIPCDSTADCPGDLACTYNVGADDDYLGACLKIGAVEGGGYCNPYGDFTQDWDDWCASSLCTDFHCSARCTEDADCPDGMSCCLNLYYDITFCQWSPGSGDDCARDADCPDGEVCAPRFDMDGVGRLACRTRECDPAGQDCLGPNQTCGPGQPPCYSGLCGSWDGAAYCWTACISNDDCPAGMACWADAMGEVTFGSCVPFAGSGYACGADSDCPADEVCIYRRGLDGYESICGDPLGDGALGDACILAADCASGRCIQQPEPAFCSAVCSADADCGPGFYCGRFFYPDWSGNFGGLCYAASGSGVPCDRDDDCDPAETCAFTDKLTEPGGYCWDASGRPGQHGDACSNRYECASLLCFDGVCSELCGDDTDCDSGDLCMGYLAYRDSPQAGGACQAFAGSAVPCTLDADCIAEEACHVVMREWQDVLIADFVCGTRNPDDGQVADECGFLRPECYNNLCLTDLIESYCSQTCLVDGDCPADLYCTAMWVEQEPDPAGVCLRFPGSRTQCTSNADCAVPGEVCNAYWPLNQPAEGRCMEGLAGGADIGAACSGAADCATRGCAPEGICTGFCGSNTDCAAYALECRLLDALGHVTPACQTPTAHTPYCSICLDDTDCPGAAVCIESAVNPGERYCSLPCVGAQDCPAGASCVDVMGSTHCKPVADTCVPG